MAVDCRKQPVMDCQTQPYVQHIDTKQHKFFVVVSCPPAVKSPRPTAIGGTMDTFRQSNTRPLHFVNTDADTIGTRNPRRGTREVKSHLSGHYRRWKKQQTLLLQAKSDQREQREHTEHVDERTGRPVPVGTVPDELRKFSITTSSGKGSDYSSNENASPPKIIARREVQHIAGGTSVQTALNYGNSDPFAAFPLPVDPETNSYIQIFHEGTTIMCWTKAIDHRLTDLLHYEGTMHGVLAMSKIMASTFMPFREGSPALLPESRQHYGHLLRLMRTDLDKLMTLNPSTAIELVHAAAMFSFLVREYNGFDLHLKKLKSIIDAMGGLKAIDPAHSLRFLNADRIRGLFLMRKPLTSIADWAPGSWFQEEKLRPFDQGHERGRQLMSSPTIPILPEGIFAYQVQDLILDYRDMLSGGSVAAALWRAKQPGSEQITPWLNFRSHSLSLRTVEIMTDITRIRRHRPSLQLSLHASACLSVNFISHLIYYASKPMIGLSYVPFPTLLEYLRDVENFVHRGALLQHQDLYLWALFTGACAELASRTWACDPSIRGSSWCSTRLAYMIESLGISTLQEFQSTLRQFLFPVMFYSYAKVLFDKRYDLLRLAMEGE